MIDCSNFMASKCARWLSTFYPYSTDVSRFGILTSSVSGKGGAVQTSPPALGSAQPHMSVKGFKKWL